MVGDYLTFTDVQNDSNCPKLKVVVIDGATNELLVSVDGDPTLDRIDIDDELCGIPLTPEILEKNGFNLRENIVVGGPKFVHEQDDGRTEIVIWLQDGMFMEVRKNIYYEDEICYTLPVPFFVHELQHCLKLCGINKTIEL